MRCVVVDDDPLSRHVIEHFVANYDALDLVGSCSNAVEASNLLQHEAVDLILLDIEMPVMTGIEFVRSLSPVPQVILVTAKEEYALEAFDVDVTDYLLKPVTFSRFLQAIQRAQRRLQPAAPASEPPAHVFVKSDGKLVKLDLNSVQWIEAQGDYVAIRTKERKLLIHSTMKALEEKLPSSLFARVHRSYIVRIDQIDDIEDTSIVIDRQVIPIGSSYREPLLQRLNTI
jgi:DNA-binding LytR/AlgR family response regulator